MLDVIETQGFRKVASATRVPMHFQLLESDVLLELLELLLVELCRAALTLSSNSCLSIRQGISFFHVALVECSILLLYLRQTMLIKRGPWPWNAGACLRGACARTRRYFQKRGGKLDLAQGLRGACA